MLEKNKDYVEFTLQCTSVEYGKTKDYKTVSFNGYSDSDFPCVPMDVVCKEFGHKVVMISKRDFDRLQADNQHCREMAKQREENHNLLLKKTGFDTVEELVNYLNSEAECNTLREAIASLEYNVKFARDERRDLSKKLDECEKDYISERDKAEALQTENEQLKKKLGEFDFMGWMESAQLWKGRYNDLFKLVGFSSTEEIQDYLTNEAECDTLHEAIFKLIKENKYACEEWCKANSSNNSWKAAAECNSPKELIEKREALEKEIGIYSRALKEWKEGTGCPSPSLAKTLIESGMSYEYAYHEAQKENRKLTDEVDSWKNVTGYSTPEEYLAARISGAFHTPFDYTASWQKATGCDAPDQVKSRIEGLENAVRLTNRNMIKEIENTIDEWQTATGCVSPEKAQYKITDLYNRIDKMKEAASIAYNWMDKIVEG